MKDLCYIIHPRSNDVNDVSGCLKKDAHNDSHICIDDRGRYIEWEDDYSCGCGCWDDLDEAPCGVYMEISKEEAEIKLKQ